MPHREHESFGSGVIAEHWPRPRPLAPGEYKADTAGVASEVRRDAPQNVRAAEPVLRAVGYRVFVIPEGVESKATFFDAVVATFPLDPPLARVQDVWDALYDSLNAGLLDVPATMLAILWPDSYRLALSEPEYYNSAAYILGALGDVLSHGQWTNDGKPKQIRVILGRDATDNDRLASQAS